MSEIGIHFRYPTSESLTVHVYVHSKLIFMLMQDEHELGHEHEHAYEHEHGYDHHEHDTWT
jgi:hypothetical protein